MTIPLSYHLFTPGIKTVLREKDAEYLFSRQEPKFLIDVFHSRDGLVEVYVHKDGHYQSLCVQPIRKAG